MHLGGDALAHLLGGGGGRGGREDGEGELHGLSLMIVGVWG